MKQKIMRDIIYSLPAQITGAIHLLQTVTANNENWKVSDKHYREVLICGMGGSGISGDITAILYPEIRILVNKDYQIPGYVDKKSLAILVSYSGNTEETLSNYHILRKLHIPVVAISSNGKLLKKDVLLKIQIPAGLPPRGALGYLFTPIPLLLYRFGLLKKNPEFVLVRLASFLNKCARSIETYSQSLAKILSGKLPVIYANSQAFGVVAKRWQCQLNENAKILCHTNIIPEMNHNEIVGLGKPEKFNKHMVILFLNDPAAFPRNKRRVEIIKEIINKDIAGLKMIDISPAGRNLFEHLFWTIMLGDFLSYHLAIRAGIDPMPVKRIDYLKNRLAEPK